MFNEKKIRESIENGSIKDIPVVQKDWGREIWVVNKEYCGKVLELKKGYRCSIHHHKEKDETFLVIEGRVLMEIDGKEWVMEAGHCQHIAPGTKHRFTGLENSRIIEFSTTHKDSDSYRDVPSGKADDKVLAKFGVK